eukprot:266554-Pyramimonas_sp.AAC.1
MPCPVKGVEVYPMSVSSICASCAWKILFAWTIGPWPGLQFAPVWMSDPRTALKSTLFALVRLVVGGARLRDGNELGDVLDARLARLVAERRQVLLVAASDGGAFL